MPRTVILVQTEVVSDFELRIDEGPKLEQCARLFNIVVHASHLFKPLTIIFGSCFKPVTPFFLSRRPRGVLFDDAEWLFDFLGTTASGHALGYLERGCLELCLFR